MGEIYAVISLLIGVRGAYFIFACFPYLTILSYSKALFCPIRGLPLTRFVIILLFYEKALRFVHPVCLFRF